MNKEVILTGLRANSEFHIGNYLGAILPTVEMQKKHSGQYQINMFIPDLHSLTTPIEHSQLYDQTIKNLAVFVAAGLDINDPNTFIYRQSYIPAHSELTWILNCFAYFGELSRMTQFKEKSGLTEDQKEEVVQQISERLDKQGIWDQIGELNDQESQKKLLDMATAPFIEEIHNTARMKTENASAGLFTYPVLMAADILLYNTLWVPVGEDQRQHLELARNLAIRMNNRFGELFTVPHEWDKQLEFVGVTSGVRIRSLRNPAKKMSKSVSDPAGTILLSDKPEDAVQKVLSATTDSLGTIHYDFEKQPGVSNLLTILALISETPQAEINAKWEGKTSYDELKVAVADQVKAFLTDLQAKLNSVNQSQLLQKLTADEDAMRNVATTTLSRVQRAVGLRPAV